MNKEYLHGRAFVKKSKGKIQIFETPYGLGDFVPVVAEGTTKPRMLKDRFSDVVNVRDFGAKGDGVTDDTAAFVSASAIGSIFVPYGTYEISVRSNDVLRSVIDALDGAVLLGTLKVRVYGHLESTKPLVVSCIGGEKLHILGEERIDIAITSVGAVSGQAGAYSVPLTLVSAEGVKVGDVLVIRGDNCTMGTGAHEVHRGAWRITSVRGNVVTVTNTCWLDSFPTFTLTGGSGYVLKSVIVFKGCDGIVVAGATLGEVDKVAISGNASEYWQASNVEGTEKGTNGVYVGGPTIAVNGKADDVNPLGITNASASLGRYTAVLDFDQQGIVCTKGASIYARWVTSSSNRRRGWYAELNGSIWCKNAVSSGNYRDGFIADVGGGIMCNISTAAGNGALGFSCITCGVIQNSKCVSSANKTNGFHVVGSGVMYAAESTAKYCDKGYVAEFGGAILGNGTIAQNNLTDGFVASAKGSIRALNCSSTDNGRYGLYAVSSGIISTSSDVVLSGNGDKDIYAAMMGVVLTGSANSDLQIPLSSHFTGRAYFEHSDGISISRGGHAGRVRLTNIGDMSFETEKFGLTLKNDSVSFHPSSDTATSCGRASNRWSSIFASTGSINTSDERSKTSIVDPDEALMRAWGKVNFRVFQFKDAVEKKGGDARLHVGVIAQQVIEAFESEGLDATRYGLLCYDKWEDEYEDIEIIDQIEVADEEGRIITPQKTHIEHRLVTLAGDRYGIRYEEALALEAAYQRWKLQKIEATLVTMGVKL